MPVGLFGISLLLTMPVGEAVWSDTELPLPEGWSGRTLEDWLTGESWVVEERLKVAQVLRAFPVALLVCRVGS